MFDTMKRMLEMVPAGEAIACQLISLRRVIDQLELKFSQLAAEFDQTDWWDYEGFNSSGDWIRFNCRMTSNAAYDRLAVGGRLAEMPRSTDAMDGGEIGFAHLAVMARTAEAVGKRFAERELLPLALELTPGKFYYKPPLPALDRLQEVRRGAERAAVQPPPLPEHGRVRPPADQRRPRPGRRGRGANGPGAVGSQVRRARRPSPAPALRRRPGRSGLGWQAGQHPGHVHHRDPERSGRGLRRGDG